MSSKAIRAQIELRTKQAFGEAIWPQLFRDCAVNELVDNRWLYSHLNKASEAILEPAISAYCALGIMLAALLISGNVSTVNIITGGTLPFVAGVLGGWLGLRRQPAWSGHSW